MNVAYLECTLCGERYRPDQTLYVCPIHGDDGVLDTIYEYKSIAEKTSPGAISDSRDYSIWRYSELLPLDDPHASAPPLQVGWTPLYHATYLGDRLGLANLFVKDDGRNPTASFKDRASAVVVAKARELGVDTITTASSGNAGAALAGMASAIRMPAVIFVPQTAPQAKVAQLLMFGAQVMLVKGTYDQAFDLCLAASKEFGWYCRNTGYNPFTVEGKKTAALEICEQLSRGSGPGYQNPNSGSNGKWVAPDRMMVSVGDGNIISGLWKGLRDLAALGWIDRMPKLMGVQAEGSAACFKAWRAGATDVEPIEAHTIADSINVGVPRDGRRAVRAVRETGGAYLTVTDEEILAAMRDLAREAAVFAEPAGATAYAGLAKAAREGLLRADEAVVCVVTGNGLKDIPSAMLAVEGFKTDNRMHVIEPALEQVRSSLSIN